MYIKYKVLTKLNVSYCHNLKNFVQWGSHRIWLGPHPSHFSKGMLQAGSCNIWANVNGYPLQKFRPGSTEGNRAKRAGLIAILRTLVIVRACAQGCVQDRSG